MARGWRLARAVLAAVVRDPTLAAHVVSSLRYPGQRDNAHLLRDGPVGELFYIGIRPEHRQRGVGQELFWALVADMRRRGLCRMGLVVDAENIGAQAFYRRQGMREADRLQLSGREMLWYELDSQSPPW
jgi:ribosomal protein S18 acetylase RimI-like enzyme